MSYLEELLVTACDELFSITVQPIISRPEEQFGDFTSNVAMQLAAQLKRPPREVAQELQRYLESRHHGPIAKVAVAGPGFLNITLSDQALWGAAQTKPAAALRGTTVLVEYSCPNAFKELHTGHLYNTILGDTICRLLEGGGATVFRANFGGDVGLHVAKCLWGAEQLLGGLKPEKLAAIVPAKQAEWLSSAYVTGAKAYETDDIAKADITAVNKAVYQFHTDDDHQSPLAQIYWECRQWSYDYFERFYADLKVAPFDKYYPESTVQERGLETVRAHIGDVFTESQGAIIFKGEEKGYHTRVFITSAGLPTYEAKDLGVLFTESDDCVYDQRILMTGNDQTEYVKVVFSALTEIDSELAAKQTHLANGTIRFGDGHKMSSRTGNVTRAIDVITQVSKAVDAKTKELRSDISLGAIKYAFLKHRLGSDIAFDIQESVSLQGNSGPYLQYAHARARSILAKASVGRELEPIFEAGERSLVRKLGQYAEVVEQATKDLSPHLICTYLYELAQVFNRFYEGSRVIGDERQDLRLGLVKAYADTLHAGLTLLNIPTPDHL